MTPEALGVYYVQTRHLTDPRIAIRKIKREIRHLQPKALAPCKNTLRLESAHRFRCQGAAHNSLQFVTPPVQRTPVNSTVVRQLLIRGNHQRSGLSGSENITR